MFKEYFSVPWYQRLIMAIFIGSFMALSRFMYDYVTDFSHFFYLIFLPFIYLLSASYGLYIMILDFLLYLGYEKTPLRKTITFIFSFIVFTLFTILCLSFIGLYAK